MFGKNILLFVNFVVTKSVYFKEQKKDMYFSMKILFTRKYLYFLNNLIYFVVCCLLFVVCTF